MSILKQSIALACLCAGAAAPGIAGAQTAVAAEFRVNTTTLGNQGSPSVASAADGRFVVVWESDSNGPSLNDIYGQRYSASGEKIGEEFRANSDTGERQSNAVVAMNASGEFVVAWNSATHLAATTGVFAQRYAADGTPRGAAFRVNSGERDIYALIGIAIAGNGDFMLTWPERGKSLPVATNIVPGYIMAQRYNADGSAKEAAITVQTSYINSLRVPSVGLDAQGGFVVSWNSDTQPGLLTPTTSLGQLLGVYARRYGADGKPLGPGFQVDVGASGVAVDRPVLAVAPDGSFALAWQTNAPDSSTLGIRMRRYDANGSALGAPVAVYAGKMQRKPAIAVDATGQIVVAGHSKGLFLRRYHADGTAGTPIRADERTANYAILQPGVAMDASGRIVAVWQAGGLDGSGRGVYARQFNP